MALDELIPTLASRSARRPASRRAARSGEAERPHAGQLSLFDVAIDSKDQAPATDGAQASAPEAKPLATKPASTRAHTRAIDQRATRVLTLSDMPIYSGAAHEAVDAALKLLPPGQLWFTYKDVHFSFGVSRATVARRLREGLVPGVAMAGAGVMEEAPVRRFDRVQLKWLLLALRHRQRQPTRDVIKS
jgi:hypothetical protein